MKKRIWEFFLLFLVGFAIYPMIEILFRGYSHISLAILGGISLILIRIVDLWGGRLRKIWKAFLAAVMITQLEFIFGMILNHGLKLNVWDYSSLPFQLAGQVSLLFSFYWFLLSFAALFILHRIKGLFPRKTL